MEATKRPLLSDDEIELLPPGAEAQPCARRRQFDGIDAAASSAAPAEPSDDAPGACAIAVAPSAEDDRRCFICLMEDDADAPLVRCCSTCYAQTHRRCWREWRNNQRLTALRSRLLGLRMQTNHLLRLCVRGSDQVGLCVENESWSGGHLRRSTSAANSVATRIMLP